MQPSPGPQPAPPVPPEFSPYPQTWAAPQRTDGKAIAALVLGILSIVGICCYMGIPLGIPAVVLGVMSLSDIKKSEGMVGGRGLAISGITTGAIGALIFLGIMGFYIAAMVEASTGTPSTPPPVAYPTPPTPTATSGPVYTYGSIHVIELRRAGGPLKTQLADEHRRATAAGESVLVETVAIKCEPCGEISTAMSNSELQSALANVAVVRVDVDEFASELKAMSMDRPDLPWFYRIDASGKATDAISADEWDDNDAENIAPILRRFLNGTLTTRKHPKPKDL